MVVSGRLLRYNHGEEKSRVVLNVSEGYVFSVAESDAREATTVSSNGAKKPLSKQSRNEELHKGFVLLPGWEKSLHSTRNEEINVLLTGST